MVCLIILSTFCINASAQVTGKNVTFVTAYKGTKAEGIFYQSGPKQWKESKGGSRVHATFQETNRDAWSVYLSDASRGVRVKLDLHTKKILVNGEVFYKIGNVKAENKNFNQSNPRRNTSHPTSSNKVTGRNLTYVRISQKGHVIGAFKKTARNKWTEYKGSKVHATFTETSRDDWSVYLKDGNRGIKVQIDLHRKKVLVNGIPLYTTSRPGSRISYNTKNNVGLITKPQVTTNNNRRFSSTSSNSKNSRMGNGRTITTGKKKITGRNLKTVSFGDDKYYLGQFIQMDRSKNWYVRSRTGSTEDYLKETRRDEWSVYLKSTKSAKEVQIDLHRKKITVKSNGKTTIYNVRKTIAH